MKGDLSVFGLVENSSAIIAGQPHWPAWLPEVFKLDLSLTRKNERLFALLNLHHEVGNRPALRQHHLVGYARGDVRHIACLEFLARSALDG